MTFFPSGFQGCIRLLKLGHQEVKIQSTHEPMAIQRVGLTECADIKRAYSHRSRPNSLQNQNTRHNPYGGGIRKGTCSGRHCLNGGTCFVDRGKARCICNEKFGGDICEYKSRTWSYEQSYGKFLYFLHRSYAMIIHQQYILNVKQ